MHTAYIYPYGPLYSQNGLVSSLDKTHRTPLSQLQLRSPIHTAPLLIVTSQRCWQIDRQLEVNIPIHLSSHLVNTPFFPCVCATVTIRVPTTQVDHIGTSGGGGRSVIARYISQRSLSRKPYMPNTPRKSGGWHELVGRRGGRDRRDTYVRMKLRAILLLPLMRATDTAPRDGTKGDWAGPGCWRPPFRPWLPLWIRHARSASPARKSLQGEK